MACVDHSDTVAGIEQNIEQRIVLDARQAEDLLQPVALERGYDRLGRGCLRDHRYSRRPAAGQ